MEMEKESGVVDREEEHIKNKYWVDSHSREDLESFFGTKPCLLSVKGANHRGPQETEETGSRLSILPARRRKDLIPCDKSNPDSAMSLVP